jgi:uncharacterized protein YabE (DUF348 family)
MTETSQTNSVTERLGGLPRSGWQAGRNLRLLFFGLALLAVLWWGYSGSTHPVTLVINGHRSSIETHNLLVENILQQMGLQLEPDDRVLPAIGATLEPGDTLTIDLARPVALEADGRIQQMLTHAQTVGELLTMANLTTHPRDEIFLNGELVTDDAPLPAPKPTRTGAAATARAEPVRLLLHRAVPVTLHNGPATSTFFSARPTVGEALLEQGITLYLGDNVTPDLGTPLLPDMHVYLQPATPVNIQVDGQTVKTRTQGETVGQVLAQEGIALMGQDYSLPPTDQPITANDTIELIRVREAMEITEEFIPFETEWIADEGMEIDQREIRQVGATGVIKTRTRVRFENGQEAKRNLEDAWLAQEPSAQIIAYGTNIVVRTLTTPDGPIEYWRRINMRSTAYSAATSGKDADHPRYGITRSGLPAGLGVVAVDPRVIPLMTDLYIEDYGPAVAGDTGGRILGKHIDLGFPDDEPLPVIFNWRDVYVLTPVPPADQIRYVLPSWPQN